MVSKFDELMKEYGIFEEKNITSTMSYSNIPVPGTEVMFIPDATNSPYVKSKGIEFQDKVKQYVTDAKKKTRKYRLIITNIQTVRPSTGLAGTDDVLGYSVDVVEQIGPVMKGSFTVPLDLLEVVNASWNQNGAEIPSDWKQDMDKYGKFAEVVKGYFVRGND